MQTAMLALGLLPCVASAVVTQHNTTFPGADEIGDDALHNPAAGAEADFGASNLTAVMLGQSQRRHLQMSAALEEGCEMNKFQQDIEYLDRQCCTRGECSDGRPPSTCPSAVCGKALADLKFGVCAETFQRVMDPAFGSALDGMSEAVELLWTDCGRAPARRGTGGRGRRVRQGRRRPPAAAHQRGKEESAA